MNAAVEVDQVTIRRDVLLDALGALHYTSDLVWDELDDSQRNATNGALNRAIEVVYGPCPDDDAGWETWDAEVVERGRLIGGGLDENGGK